MDLLAVLVEAAFQGRDDAALISYPPIVQVQQNTEPPHLTPLEEAKASYNAGHFYLSRNQPLRAAEFFGRVIQLKPYNRFGYISAGYALMEGGKFDEAKKTLDGLLKMYPDDWFGNSIYGQIYLNEGKEREAVDCFEKAGIDGRLSLAIYYFFKESTERDYKQVAQELLERTLVEFKDGDPTKWEGELKFRYAIGICNREGEIIYSKKVSSYEAVKALLIKMKMYRSGDVDQCFKDFGELFPQEDPESLRKLFRQYILPGRFRIKIHMFEDIGKAFI